MTVTLNVARPISPTLLIDQQLTVVVPIGNVDPDRGRQCAWRDPSIASFADAVNVAGAPASDVAATVTSPEVVTTGGGGFSTLGDSFAAVSRWTLVDGLRLSPYVSRTGS